MKCNIAITAVARSSSEFEYSCGLIASERLRMLHRVHHRHVVVRHGWQRGRTIGRTREPSSREGGQGRP